MGKSGKEYWNGLWASSDIPAAVDPSDKRLKNHVNRRFHQLFMRLFKKSETPSMRLLEIGCAKSAWLPYFAKEFGFVVSGLDYSPVGCEVARKILQENGVVGEIVCADLFSPPAHMLEVFDVVVSLGVVEHFDDTPSCLRAASSFLKSGGILITSIPNMVGWIGAVQKAINRPVYEIHKLIDSVMLREAHEIAGLEVLECNYFVSTSFFVPNLAGVSTRTIIGFLKKLFLAILTRASMLVWLIENRIGDFTPQKFISPYIICVSRRPQCATKPSLRAR